MPRKDPQELNARALIEENITPPIILSRDEDRAKGRSPARLSQVRGNVLAEKRGDTPRNMYYDDDDAPLSIHSADARARGRSTQVNLPASRRNRPDVVPHNDYHHPRHNRNDVDDQDSVISVVTPVSGRVNKSKNGVPPVMMVPYRHVPDHKTNPDKRDVYASRRHYYSTHENVPVSPWWVVLKVVELVVCFIIIIVTRVGYEELEHDIIFTMFAFVGVCASGLALLLMWTKGQPAPNHCLHTLMLGAYLFTAAVMLCGAILVLTQSDLNGYAAGTAALFFVALILFAADAVLMAIALLYCTCLPFPEFLKPRHQPPPRRRTRVRSKSRTRTHPMVVEDRRRRHRDTHPVAAVEDNPDYYYVRYYNRKPSDTQHHSVFSDGDGISRVAHGNSVNNDGGAYRQGVNSVGGASRHSVYSGEGARRHSVYSGEGARRHSVYSGEGARRHSVYSGEGGGMGSDYYSFQSRHPGGSDYNSNDSRYYQPVGELLHDPAYVDRYGQYLRDRYPPVGHPYNPSTLNRR